MYYTLADNVEPVVEYRPGGYHPIVPDDKLSEGRYTVMQELGYGGYAVIWLARDAKEKNYVALKIGKSDRSDYLRKEIAVLRALSGEHNVPEVIDAFDIDGCNGKHACYTMAFAAGNLATAVYHDLFHIIVARALSARLAKIVSFLHRRGYCHGDLRLENILAQLNRNIDNLDVDQFKSTIGLPRMSPVFRIDNQPLTPHVPPQVCSAIRRFNRTASEFTLENARNIILADFGEASRPLIDPLLGKQCYIPLDQRAPEALFQPNEIISYPSDIWSLACAIWNILGSDTLFISGDKNRDILIADHLAALGPDILPSAWREEWESEEFDDLTSSSDDVPRARRWLLQGEYVMSSLEPRFEELVQDARGRAGTPVFEEDERQAILALMRGMLAYDPKDRLDIDGVLRSDWMVKWALPALGDNEDRAIN